MTLGLLNTGLRKWAITSAPQPWNRFSRARMPGGFKTYLRAVCLCQQGFGGVHVFGPGGIKNVIGDAGFCRFTPDRVWVERDEACCSRQAGKLDYRQTYRSATGDHNAVAYPHFRTAHRVKADAQYIEKNSVFHGHPLRNEKQLVLGKLRHHILRISALRAGPDSHCIGESAGTGIGIA